jgi:hypothetical protein
MTEKEARELIGMIEGHWRVDFGPQGRELWLSLMLPYDAQLTSEAVCELGKSQQRAPAFADVRSAILALHKSRRDENALPEQTKPGKTPEWVWVWTWLRDRGEERFLPQQGEWSDPAQTMSQHDYEALRAEWVKAGRPRRRAALLGA